MTLFGLRHYENGDYVKSFLNTEVEACLNLKLSSGNPLIRNLYEDFRKFGRIPIKCPIKKVRIGTQVAGFFMGFTFQGLYFMKNYILPTKFFPVILPSDKFRFDFIVRTKVDDELVTVFGLEVFINFVPKNKTN
jgi:Protein of unknown function (DUF1091)